MNQVVAIIFCCLIGFAGASLASESTAVKFPEKYLDEGVTMKLQGVGLKHALFFRAFVAGFYAEPASKEDVLGEVHKHLEVEYFVNIPAKKLNAFTLDHMKHNVSSSQSKMISREIDLMGKYFVDLKKGDRFSLTYIPGVGTKFAHNGKLTGIIAGKDFAKALFSVWIGEHPFDRHLKNEILGLLHTGTIKHP
jgi:hypothetical protein